MSVRPCPVHPRPVRFATASVGAASLLALTLAGCGYGAPAPGAAASPSGPSAASGTAAATVRVASTRLGPVVVGAAGRTLYMFTKDTKDSGKSVCAGPCTTAWPAFTTTVTPTTDGVSGTLGTLTTAGGTKQVTLGGWPLYYFDKDKAPGDVLGQDVGTIWFALDANGTPVKAAGS